MARAVLFGPEQIRLGNVPAISIHEHLTGFHDGRELVRLLEILRFRVRRSLGLQRSHDRHDGLGRFYVNGTVLSPGLSPVLLAFARRIGHRSDARDTRSARVLRLPSRSAYDCDAAALSSNGSSEILNRSPAAGNSPVSSELPLTSVA